MSWNAIYDTLVSEFTEAGMYYGGGMELPERVSLSAYDDTVIMPAVKVAVAPSQAAEMVFEAPKSMAAIQTLKERIALLHSDEPINVPEASIDIPEETTETVVIQAPRTDIIRSIRMDEAASNTMTTVDLARYETKSVVGVKEEVQHVFPIKKKHPHIQAFSYFSKADKHQKMHAA